MVGGNLPQWCFCAHLDAKSRATMNTETFVWSDLCVTSSSRTRKSTLQVQDSKWSLSLWTPEHISWCHLLVSLASLSNYRSMSMWSRTASCPKEGKHIQLQRSPPDLIPEYSALLLGTTVCFHLLHWWLTLYCSVFNYVFPVLITDLQTTAKIYSFNTFSVLLKILLLRKKEENGFHISTGYRLRFILYA